MSKKHFFRGTIILACSGFICRFIGFFYRIFLSHTIGAEGLGIYQLIMPLQTLILALTTIGLQTTISRLCASNLALKKEKTARNYFSIGTFTALLLSASASWFLYSNARFFAEQILKEARTFPLIQLMAFCIPLSTLHTCINSFYFARKKTGFPAGMQLFEQLVRVCASYLIYLILLSENRKITPIIAVGGSLAGELAVSIVSLIFLRIDFRQHQYSIFRLTAPFLYFKEMICFSFPLTLNRVLLTLLNSIESVMIPQQLLYFGLTSTEALSIYGILTGMALPIILFPGALTNSAAVMLMPSIAQLHAKGYQKRIRYITTRICLSCFSMGIFFAFIFLIFGKTLGSILFKSAVSGIYIHTLSFICPFLYLNTTLTSILHGLGKNNTCLFHNIITILLRIGFIFFAIPKLGILGYIYGILSSEILSCILHFAALFRFNRSASLDLPIDNKKRMVYNECHKTTT